MTPTLHAKLLAASLLSREQNLTFLTGSSGAGKTTLCAGIVAQVQAAGSSVGGFICPPVFQEGKKVGIDMLNVASKERRRLGRWAQNTRETTVGCWWLDEEVIAWGNRILAGLKDEQVIFIDELGPLELKKGYGYQEALRLLDEGHYCKAIVVVRPALLSLARSRWPEAHILDLERKRV